MPGRSIHRNIAVDLALVQGAQAAPINTNAFGCQGFDSVTFSAIISAVGGAGGTLTLQVSDTIGGTYVAADPADVISSRTNLADSNVLVAGETTFASYIGIRPFVRATVTPVTSATGSVICLRNTVLLAPVNPGAV